MKCVWWSKHCKNILLLEGRSILYCVFCNQVTAVPTYVINSLLCSGRSDLEVPCYKSELNCTYIYSRDILSNRALLSTTVLDLWAMNGKAMRRNDRGPFKLTTQNCVLKCYINPRRSLFVTIGFLRSQISRYPKTVKYLVPLIF
jgi:hypothetical protein